jgi:hypothetical protein
MRPRGYGSTAMGSDAVGATPIAVFVLTSVIVTLRTDSPLLLHRAADVSGR